MSKSFPAGNVEHDLAVGCEAGLRASRGERLLWSLLAVQRLHDPDTVTHEQRVAYYAARLARELECAEDGVDLLRKAALVHDIGKIGIAAGVLHKPGALTPRELALMRTHPALGRHMLLQAGDEFARLAEIVHAHHERWDGKGYPQGLIGEAAPLGARIVAVADAFDAMTVTRPYQQARPVAEALAELVRCTGASYDPTVVAAFSRLLAALEHEGIALPVAGGACAQSGVFHPLEEMGEEAKEVCKKDSRYLATSDGGREVRIW